MVQKEKDSIKKVLALRDSLYESAENTNTDEFNYEKAKTLHKTATVIISTYRVQMEALKMAGRRTEAQELKGLLDK